MYILKEQATVKTVYIRVHVKRTYDGTNISYIRVKRTRDSKSMYKGKYKCADQKPISNGAQFNV